LLDGGSNVSDMYVAQDILYLPMFVQTGTVREYGNSQLHLSSPQQLSLPGCRRTVVAKGLSPVSCMIHFTIIRVAGQGNCLLDGLLGSDGSCLQEFCMWNSK